MILGKPFRRSSLDIVGVGRQQMTDENEPTDEPRKTRKGHSWVSPAPLFALPLIALETSV